ncbi:MAG: ABC transporter permease [Bacteroidota bacterium]
MIKHYLLTTLRILVRHRLYSILNIVGLATGLAACLLILQYVRFERSYEEMHQNADRIARITLDYYDGETMTDQDAETYRPLGPAIVNEIPEAVDFCRLHHFDVREFTYGDKIYQEERVYMGTASTLNMFSYRFLEGDPQSVLQNPFELLVTQSMAQKYFGAEDPMGKVLTMYYGDEKVELNIVGILADLPKNTHLKFDCLISYKTGFAIEDWEEETWNSNNDYTYVLLRSKDDHASFSEKLYAFNQRLHKKEIMEDEFAIAQPLKDLHLYSHKPFEPEVNGDSQSVTFLQIIAFFILFMAVVNYINLATARALDRAKEVGIRKTIGSQRSQLIKQFLFETALIHVFAGGFCLSIIQLSQPAFESLTGIPSTGLFITTPQFWMLFLGLIGLSTLLAGLYPAWVLSGYKPIFMLKGNFLHSNQGKMIRQGLVVAQFSLSLLLITGALVVRSQFIFIKNKSLGTNIEQTLVLRAPGQDSARNQYNAFKNTLLQSPLVQSASLSTIVPGNAVHDMSTTTGINLHGADQRINIAFNLFWIDEYFLPQMEIPLLAGENFSPNSQGEKVIVNEKSLTFWNLDSPEEAVGKKIDYWGRSWTIIGVVKNYHHRSAKEPFIPMIMMYTNGFWGFASVKSATPDTRAFVQAVQKSWKTYFASSSLSFYFLDENYQKQYNNDTRFLRVFSLLTGLAILIAALGLIGLASYMALKRTKEIGIRKVLGATVQNILLLLSKDFFQLLLVAGILTLPIAYLGVSYWLNRFPFRTELSGNMFLIPILILLMVAGLAIAYQILRAAKVNPIESLKYE